MTPQPSGDWISGARRVPSPNCDDRPAGVAVDLVVLHCISLPPGRYGGDHMDELFLNRLDRAAHPYFAEVADLRVSAHCLIDRAGALTQYVALSQRAWHAGRSTYDGRPACNDFSVGIELEGVDDGPFTAAQYSRLVACLAFLLARFPDLHAHRIVGHSDVAPGRKTDPGPGFDWARLHELLAGAT